MGSLKSWFWICVTNSVRKSDEVNDVLLLLELEDDELLLDLEVELVLEYKEALFIVELIIYLLSLNVGIKSIAG